MNAKTETIVTAKTVEEALARACAELGAPSVDALTYTVLEEPKRGLFGLGAQPARVQASYTAPAAPAAEPSSAAANAAAPAAEAKADPALDFIQTLIRNMELDVKVTVTEPAAGEKYISIEGDAAGVLIGHHGDTLDSLQYLTNLAVNKKRGDDKRDYVKVTVDVENYRAKREETLRALARRKAEAVLKYGKSIMLEPMNPYERRIIHSEIQLIDGVSTNSVGTDNNRKIVIFPEDRGTLARGKKKDEE
ncbi:MAG: protein jag [Clostridia bacterium]|nr:protein jag [Clostridia bacterium]